MNVRNNDGETPLHMACWYNNVPAVAALLARPGVEVSVESVLGNRPVTKAVLWCNREVVELLLGDGRVELGEGLEDQVGRNDRRNTLWD